MAFTWTVIAPDLPEGVEQIARGLKLDPSTGDLVVPFEMVRGVEAVAQHVALRLKLFLGEWFLDTDDGTDWFGAVLGKNYDPDLARAVLAERITGTPGVLDLVKLDLTFDRSARTLSIRADVTSDLGEFVLQTEGAI